MPLNIKDDEIHAMAKRLAARRGTSLTDAVGEALRSALENDTTRKSVESRRRRAEAAIQRCAALQTIDNRSADEILGYDADGLPQ